MEFLSRFLGLTTVARRTSPQAPVKELISRYQEAAMSGPRRRDFHSHASTTKTLISITVFLIVVVSICTLPTFPHALAATIVSDDFNDNSIDTAKWTTNLISCCLDTNVPLAETSQQLEIGPLLQNVNGYSHRGLSTVNTYNFDDTYAYVELVQAPASNTNAVAIFSVCSDLFLCYRIYETAGNLIGVRRTPIGRGGVETVLFSISYDTTDHRFLRIRNDSGNLHMDTAPGTGGVPGTWTQQYSEVWNSSISTSAIIFELKGGTSQVEANSPGTVIFDNFVAATP